MRDATGRLIERVLFRGLVFNQSWEDPRLDEAALRIRPEVDTVLTVTSGGCNVLNLLCLRPRRIVSIDINPAQTHLLGLKLAAATHLGYDDFFTLFGGSDGPAAASVYRSALRRRLSGDLRAYWDANLRLLERGLPSQGRLGLFLRTVQRWVRFRVGEERLERFFAIDDLDRQRDVFYAEIEPRLWRGPVVPLLGSRPVMAIAGMHPSQHELIRGNGGLADYMRDRLEYVMTSVPIRDNYFAARAVLGRYLDREHVPPYLLEGNFAVLKETAGRVVNLTGRLGDHLDTLAEGSVDKFSLLDVADWMDAPTRLSTFASVVRAGADGGRFVYRSTVASLPVPDPVSASVVAEDGLARRLFAGDRSATYSSFYVYRIDKSAGGAVP